MKKQKGKSRATHVAGDMRKRRLQGLLRVCVALLLPTLYLFYCLSGLYIIDVEMSKLKEQIVWCLLHLGSFLTIKVSVWCLWADVF